MALYELTITVIIQNPVGVGQFPPFRPKFTGAVGAEKFSEFYITLQDSISFTLNLVAARAVDIDRINMIVDIAVIIERLNEIDDFIMSKYTIEKVFK